MKKIVKFAHAHDTPIGIQLCHAGRKASTIAPWEHSGLTDQKQHVPLVASEEEDGWPDNGMNLIVRYTYYGLSKATVYSASDIPFSDTYPKPKAMTEQDFQYVEEAFVKAVERCKDIGCRYSRYHYPANYR